jgi:hypothetical protein
MPPRSTHLMTMAFLATQMCALGCSRTLVLPAAEGVRAVHAIEAGRPAFVESDGARRRVETFDAVLVRTERRLTRHERPVRLELDDFELIVTEGERPATRYRRDQIEGLILRERTPSRGLIIGGTAVLTGVAVGAGLLAALSARHEEGPHGNWPLIQGSILVGAGAGALTLPFTSSATKTLGTEVE